jgi:DNA-binding beta-propeller fold protein YncE
VKSFVLGLICWGLILVIYPHVAHGLEKYSVLEVWGLPCINSESLNCSQKNLNSQFRFPAAIDIDSRGYVYVADSWNDHIQKLNDSGVSIGKWGSPGSLNGQFRFPSGLAVDSQGNVYVTDFGNSRVQKFTSDGKFITKWGSRGSGDGQFSRPQGVGVDSQGNVYVADFGNSRVQKFTPDGKFITKWGSRGSGDGQFGSGDLVVFTGPTDIAVDSHEDVYVADFGNSRVQKFTSDGKFLTKWGSRGSGDSQFFLPQGITVDSEGYVYVADSANDIIQKFNSSGLFITKLNPYFYSDDGGNSIFQGPSGIAVNPTNGLLYLSDTWSDSIQVFYPSS